MPRTSRGLALRAELGWREEGVSGERMVVVERRSFEQGIVVVGLAGAEC